MIENELKYKRLFYILVFIPFVAIVHIVGEIIGMDAWVIVAVQLPLLGIQISSGVWYIQYLRLKRKEFEKKLKEMQNKYGN